MSISSTKHLWLLLHCHRIQKIVRVPMWMYLCMLFVQTNAIRWTKCIINYVNCPNGINPNDREEKINNGSSRTGGEYIIKDYFSQTFDFHRLAKDHWSSNVLRSMNHEPKNIGQCILPIANFRQSNLTNHVKPANVFAHFKW